MSISVAVVGATGKLGSFAVSVIEQTDGLELAAALNSSSTPDRMLAADVILDVTRPAVSSDIVAVAIANDCKILVGTSGWSADRIATLHTPLQEHPAAGVVIVPNFSLGSVLATSLAAQAAAFYDSIEIVEAHSEHKVDSPSGTAVRTAELMEAARSSKAPVAAPHADQPARGQLVGGIPVHSLRMSGTVARQRVFLGGLGETLIIEHDTVSQEAYRAGLVLALQKTVLASGLTVGLESLLELRADR